MKVIGLESKDLIGKRWGELTEVQQLQLISICSVWNDIKEGECIVDIYENLSIVGRIVKEFIDENGTIEIDDDAVFYNPID